MAREKTETCPECGGEFTPQGLAGHLRMSHGLDASDLSDIREKHKEALTLADRKQRTLDLIDDLQECKQKRKQIGELDEGGTFWNDKSSSEAEEALEKLIDDIRAELRRLGTDTEEDPEEQPA
jgi:CelD/BcsL family acetyltransferase involved in cellulose biosynthesis